MAAYAISALVSFILIAVLWWLHIRFSDDRRLWRWLALGATVNMTGTVLWGLLSLIRIEPLQRVLLDVINALYILRYPLTAIALWRYPKPLTRYHAIAVLGVMAVGAGALWFGVAQPLMARSDQAESTILAGALFPLMDVGMVALGWMHAARCRRDQDQLTMPCKVLAALALSMTSYGIANWMNFAVRAVTPGADAAGPLLFWFLGEVFVGLTIWIYLSARPALII
jgi:hypothetical protein